MNTSLPNLFNYATSELSQDAFLLWFLDWANPQYEKADERLHAAAQTFVRSLLDTPNLEICSVDCKKQEHHIDVFAIVSATNNIQYALIIEDKTDTKEHGEQISRYQEWVEKHPNYHSLELHCVYYKTGNESRYYLSKLSTDCKVILRKDILKILMTNIFPPSLNPIFIDYINHLRKIEKQTQSYKSKSVEKWGSRAWQGFYMELEDNLNEKLSSEQKEDDSKKLCKWMNDPLEDTWIFKLPKFSIQGSDAVKLYLQISPKDLSIRTYCDPKKVQKEGWSSIIKKALHSDNFAKNISQLGLSIEKSQRIGETKNTTFVNIKNGNGSSFISGTEVELKEIVSKLIQLQELLSIEAKKLSFSSPS